MYFTYNPFYYQVPRNHISRYKYQASKKYLPTICLMTSATRVDLTFHLCLIENFLPTHKSRLKIWRSSKPCFTAPCLTCSPHTDSPYCFKTSTNPTYPRSEPSSFSSTRSCIRTTETSPTSSSTSPESRRSWTTFSSIFSSKCLRKIWIGPLSVRETVTPAQWQTAFSGTKCKTIFDWIRAKGWQE